MQHPAGKGNQHEAADTKARQVELYGIELSGHHLQRDFHCAEKKRGQRDKHITSFHNRFLIVGKQAQHSELSCRVSF